MIPVHLTQADVAWATKVGRARWDMVQRQGRKAKFAGAKLEDHVDGAAGELAFCRAVGLVWPASNGWFTSAPDVWPDWEVRTLRRMRGVKVVDSDPDHRLVVWVRGQVPKFEVMGFIRAGGAKQHADWRTDPGKRGRAIWLVPPDKMIPIDAKFHSGHAFHRVDDRWECVHCGEVIEWAA